MSTKTKTQYGALPYMILGKRVRVLLITSRSAQRWIIPKGWPEKGVPPHRLAALEAYEEGGIGGKTGKRCIGNFTYTKVLDKKSRARCRVSVFPLKVDRQFLDWPEKGQRRLRWVSPKKAAELVREKSLQKLLRDFRP